MVERCRGGRKALIAKARSTRLRSVAVRSVMSVPPLPLKLQPTPLSVETVNPKVVAAEYAVRGEIVRRAQAIQKDLEEGKKKYPFEKIVWCNIGNPQILGQKPITYFRQVLALCEYRELLENPLADQIFPSDVLLKARQIAYAIPGGMGAYSESPGCMVVRQMVADAITKRDGYECNPEDIFMTDGASPGVHYMMESFLCNSNDAFMVPIPQYPLYSATLALYGGQLASYYLDESQGWGLDVEHLKEQVRVARTRGLRIRGLVVINPGNPTGQCLSRENQEEILRFCRKEGLILLADEVYQTNIYADTKDWLSFKRIACELGMLNEVPLVSLHSTSKGFVGECGRRGGYMEITGFPDDVREQILKLASINLCPNVSGQICCALMMNPPEEGEPSYELYVQERDDILGSLKRRAVMLVAQLNKLEGVSCNDAEGALYAFPQVRLPQAAVEEARKIGKSPDFLYCKQLLEQTGIVVVPGSGFGQRDGTFHFRTTFLPSEQDLGEVVERLGEFHLNFMRQHGASNGAH